MGAVAPYIRDIIDGVLKIAELIGDWIRDTHDIKQAPAYDERTATIDETVKMNELLTEKRNSFKRVCNDIEVEIRKSTTSAFDQLLKAVNGIETECGIAISFEFIKNEFEKFKADLNDGLSKMVMRRLALSDPECAGIMKEEAGEQRSREIDQFIQKIIFEGCREFMAKFAEIKTKAFKLVGDRADEKIMEKEALVDTSLKEIESINRELSKAEIKEKQAEYKENLQILDSFITSE
jgi:hypothetical protein